MSQNIRNVILKNRIVFRIYLFHSIYVWLLFISGVHTRINLADGIETMIYVLNVLHLQLKEVGMIQSLESWQNQGKYKTTHPPRFLPVKIIFDPRTNNLP